MRKRLKAIGRAFQDRWDWWIYFRAVHSLRRICERQPGFAYLIELWIRKWRSRHPITPQLQESTEAFFQSLLDEDARQRDLRSAEERITGEAAGRFRGLHPGE